MKNLISGIFIIFLCISCAGTKKSTQSKETDSKEIVTQKDSAAETVDRKIVKNDVKKDSTSSVTKTTIKYRPEIDPSTGKTKPFKMQTTRNGSVNGSVEIDGSGEVTIENLSSDIAKSSAENKEAISELTAKFNSRIDAAEKTSKANEETVKTQSSSIFKLYIIIIILGILLLISLYFNFRSRISRII